MKKTKKGNLLALIIFFEVIAYSIVLGWAEPIVKDFSKTELSSFFDSVGSVYNLSLLVIPIVGFISGRFLNSSKWLKWSVLLLACVCLLLSIASVFDLKILNLFYALLALYSISRAFFHINILSLIGSSYSLSDQSSRLGFVVVFIAYASSYAFTNSSFIEYLSHSSIALLLFSILFFLSLSLVDLFDDEENSLLKNSDVSDSTLGGGTRKKKMINWALLAVVILGFWFGSTALETVSQHVIHHTRRMAGWNPFDARSLRNMALYLPVLIAIGFYGILSITKSTCSARLLGLSYLLILIPIGLFYFYIKKQPGDSTRHGIQLFYCVLFVAIAKASVFIMTFTVVARNALNKYLLFLLGLLWYVIRTSKTTGESIIRSSRNAPDLPYFLVGIVVFVGIVILVLGFVRNGLELDEVTGLEFRETK